MPTGLAMKPRLLLLADKRDWVFGSIARNVATGLKDRYSFRIVYLDKKLPHLNAADFDLLYVFFWGEQSWKQFDIPPHKVVREVASYRWRDELLPSSLSTEAFCKLFLNDCVYVTTPALRIKDELSEFRRLVRHVPNGIDADVFKPTGRRTGPLKIGWAGNPNDGLKGLRDVLIPATDGRFTFVHTDGNLTRSQMVDFYNDVDVIAVSSKSEGQPMPLMEAMACGCFPVATDVGIVPELVRHEDNGLIVPREIGAFERAFEWCSSNIEYVRSVGAHNSTLVRDTRSWRSVLPEVGEVIDEILTRAEADQDIGLSHGATGRLERLQCPEPPREELPLDGYVDHLGRIQGDHQVAYEALKQGLNDELKHVLPVDKDQVILEIGIGFGYVINLLMELGYRNVIAVDRSRDFVDGVRRRHGAKLRKACWCDGVEFLSKNKSTFDCIILLDVIEHIPVPEMVGFLKSLYESLSDGGRVLIRTPNMALPLSSFSRYIDFTHQVGFTEFSLIQLLSLAGFSQIELVRDRPKQGWWSELEFRLYRYLLRRLYRMEGRTMPTCFNKNLVVMACKTGADV